MIHIRLNRPGGKPPGLLAQLFGLLLGIVILLFSLVVGAFVLAGMLGLIVIIAIVMVLRAWWLGRQVRGRHAPAADEEVIEAEYRVVSSEYEEDRRDD